MFSNINQRILKSALDCGTIHFYSTVAPSNGKPLLSSKNNPYPPLKQMTKLKNRIIVKKGGLKLKLKQHKSQSKLTSNSTSTKINSIRQEIGQKQLSSEKFDSLQSKINSITASSQKEAIMKKDSKDNNEFDSINDPFASLFGKNQNESVDMSDTFLALKSLIQRESAAFFEPLQCTSSTFETNKTNIFHPNQNHVFPFVLRQMLHQVLLSQSCPRSQKKIEKSFFSSKCQYSNTIPLDNQAEAATEVMREISMLQRQNRIRLLKLPLQSSSSSFLTEKAKKRKMGKGASYQQHEEDIAIMETETYIEAVKQAMHIYSKESMSTSSLILSIIQTFLSIISTETRMSISHSKLIKYFSFTPSYCIDILVQKRFLVPSHSNPSESLSEIYYFTLPTLGKAVHQIHQGRQSILKSLRMTYRNEIPRKALMEKTFSNGRQSNLYNLPMSFHLRDLISIGKVAWIERPSGIFVKLVENARKTTKV